MDDVSALIPVIECDDEEDLSANEHIVMDGVPSIKYDISSTQFL